LFLFTQVNAAPAVCSGGKDEMCPSSDQYCAASNKCLPKRLDGISCVANHECKSDSCIENKCASSAASTEKKPYEAIAPTLQIAIPTIQPFTTKGIGQPDKDGMIELPFIGQYFAGLYQWALLVAGLICAAFIVFGGFMYVTSSGDKQKITLAKERITAALSGLFLLLSSYTILYIINPDLVNFKSSKIQVIEREELDIQQIVNAGTDNDAAAEGVEPNCAADSDLQKIKGMVKLSGAALKDDYLHKDAINALKKANEIAASYGKKLVVIAAARTKQKQEYLWAMALKKYGSEEIARKKVAKPSCSAPHMTGRAIDACLDGPTCSKVAGDFTLTDQDITDLQKIMQAAGWKRYCPEWWHFEYGLKASGRCSP